MSPAARRSKKFLRAKDNDNTLQKAAKSKQKSIDLTKLVVDAFFNGKRKSWLGVHDFCKSMRSKSEDSELTTDLSFFKSLAAKARVKLRKNESVADYCERIYYESDYPSIWELIKRNFNILPTLTANRQVVELQKWGRTLLMLPFWHLVLTGGWNKASLRTKARIRGKKGENIRAQLEGLQALKNYLSVFYSMRGSVGLAEILSPRRLLHGRQARTSYFLGRVNKTNMRKLKMMHDCIQQISQLVELNGGMIDQMNKDDKIDEWWFKMERLAIDEERNKRERETHWEFGPREKANLLGSLVAAAAGAAGASAAASEPPMAYAVPQ